MDFFQHPYYRTVKILLTVAGQWPRQCTFYSSGALAVFCVVTFTQLVPQIVIVIKSRDDMIIAMQSALTLLLIVVLYTKAICSKWNTQKIVQLMNRIREDWQVWTRNQEVNILHDYAELGRKMILGWVVAVTAAAIFITIPPVIPKIIDTLLSNGSKHGTFPIPVDYYFFDPQKYYFYVIAHIYFSVSMGLLYITHFDCVFIVSVQHACGIFAALGHRLNEIGKNKKLSKRGDTSSASNNEDKDFETLVWCIRRHNDAIEYAYLIEATFSWSFFYTVGLNMLAISLAGYQIVKCTADPQEIVKFVVAITTAFGHIYFESYMAQILMDHSISIRNSIISSNWYEESPKVQKLLYVMMIRCNDSSQLTVGKMSIMCFETFTSIVKTSMSCLTVLRSM